MNDDGMIGLLRRIDALEQALKRQQTFPGSSLDLIEGKNSDAGAVASFDFQSIPATYSKLILDMYARGDTAATNIGIRMTFNNDASAIYESIRANVRHSATWTSAEELAQTWCGVAFIAAANAPAGTFDLVKIDVPAYANVNGQKVLSAEYTHRDNTTTANLFRGVTAGWYRSTNAISRITLIPAAGNFAQFSTARLYGVY